MEDELNSRNTSIQRAHDPAKDDFLDFPDLSRHKRMRESPENPEEASPPDGGPKKQKLGSVPRVNWNAGTKAAIRTSLKRKERIAGRRAKSARSRRQMAGQQRIVHTV